MSTSKKHFIFLLITGFIIHIPIWFIDFGGQSYINNYLWSKYFAESLLNGEFFPKWLSKTSAGCGSSVFFFYPPFPYYISSLFYFLPKAHDNVIITFILTHAFAGFAFYLWLIEWCKKRTAVLASFIYILMPYMWIDIYVRSAFTEFFSFALIPLLLKFSFKIINGNLKYIYLFSIVYALLIMSSPHGTLLGSLLILAYSFHLFYKTNSYKAVLTMALAAILGVGISSLYLLPMIEVLPYAFLDLNSNTFQNHYYFANNFFPSDKYSISIFILNFLSSLPILFVKQDNGKNPTNKRGFIFWFGIIIFSLFMTTVFAYPIWKLLPFLQILQFPWRFSILITIAVPTLLAHIIDLKEKNDTPLPIKKMLYILLLFTLTSASIVYYREKPANHALGIKYSIVHFPNEYIPRTADKKWLIAPNIEILEKNFKDKYDFCMIGKLTSESNSIENLNIKNWQNRELEFTIELNQNDIIKIGQFYFPNWAAYEGQEEVEINKSEEGFISLALQKGMHDIKIKMELWKSEVYGYIISAISLFIALLGLSLTKPTFRKNKLKN